MSRATPSLLEVRGPRHPLVDDHVHRPVDAPGELRDRTGRTEDRIRAVGAGGEVGIRPLDRVFDVAGVEEHVDAGVDDELRRSPANRRDRRGLFVDRHEPDGRRVLEVDSDEARRPGRPGGAAGSP